MEYALRKLMLMAESRGWATFPLGSKEREAMDLAKAALTPVAKKIDAPVEVVTPIEEEIKEPVKSTRKKKGTK